MEPPFTDDCKIHYQAQLWAGKTFLKSKSFARRLDADRWISRETTFLIDPDLRPKESVAWSCGSFFDEQFIKNKRCEEGTRIDWKRLFDIYVRPYYDGRDIETISSQEWTNHLTSRVRKGLGHARSNRLRTLVSSMYSFGVKNELFAKNPIIKVELFEEDQTVREKWTREEAVRFFLGIGLTKHLYGYSFKWLTKPECGLEKSKP